jgi:hypothetical protein
VEQASAEILGRLARERIESLYHFTSIENLPLIGGIGALCSKAVLEEFGYWPVPVPGGNELSRDLDQGRGNWDKVSISFTPRTPMIYWRKRQTHLCFFVLRPEVAGLPGTVFTDTNATTTGHRRSEGVAGLELVDFAAVRATPRPGDREGWHRPVQAEVLIPGCADLDYVSEVVFPSAASMTDGSKLWGDNPHPPFNIKPALFSDDPRATSDRLPFPYLQEIMLTKESVTSGEDARRYRAPVTTFHRDSGEDVTFIARVWTQAGVVAKLSWSNGRQWEHVFESTSSFYHWGKIPLNTCSPGVNQLTYSLNGIRWATIDFDVL